MVLSERSLPCPRCGWITHEDGACARCADDARAPRCPPVATWDPAFKAWVVQTYMRSVMATHGDDAARIQAAAEKMLHGIVQARGLSRRWVIPAGVTYELTVQLFHRTQRPAGAGQEPG